MVSSASLAVSGVHLCNTAWQRIRGPSASRPTGHRAPSVTGKRCTICPRPGTCREYGGLKAPASTPIRDRTDAFRCLTEVAEWSQVGVVGWVTRSISSWLRRAGVGRCARFLTGQLFRWGYTAKRVAEPGMDLTAATDIDSLGGQERRSWRRRRCLNATQGDCQPIPDQNL